MTFPRFQLTIPPGSQVNHIQKGNLVLQKYSGYQAPFPYRLYHLITDKLKVTPKVCRSVRCRPEASTYLRASPTPLPQKMEPAGASYSMCKHNNRVSITILGRGISCSTRAMKRFSSPYLRSTESV